MCCFYEVKGYEDSNEKAIDDFMASPKASSSLRRTQTSMRPDGRYGGGFMPNKGMAKNGSFQKTGVCVSKCYQMLCGRCGKRFASKSTHSTTSPVGWHISHVLNSYFWGWKVAREMVETMCVIFLFFYRAEIMILEMTVDIENMTAFEVQALFNSTQSKSKTIETS